MESQRELYKQKYQAQLSEWEAKISKLKANSEKLAAQAKIDMKPKLDTVHEKFEAAKSQLQELTSATEDKVEEGAKAIDRTWQDLKAAVEGGFDAIKSHRPRN